MKKLSTSIFAAFAAMAMILTSVDVMAQKIDTTVKKIGDKTASTAVKSVATVKDKIYKGKESPIGTVVYIDSKDRKYYVDKKGKKVFLKPSQIKDKKE